ncbi:hypothetical protein VA596_41785 [Amycolatopsis sp., V23-08]|uniref:Uncharacterized protein n=1 Tax=Amycolatopsis heterodermiae TaxID=3110235 RepID=A0ABU5RK63_9PSEU|nr:hypothetical protein [Amycolatopsis sp., V23-08]MEA5366119.1 hypothetical protein [Amycolatopsis sp., V23-08]
MSDLDDNLVLGRLTIAERDAAFARVRAHFDDGEPLGTDDVRTLLADHARATSLVTQLQERLRGEKHHHENDVQRLTTERDALRTQVAAQEQTLQIVTEQTNDCVEKVDAALGHRYHIPGVHYSVPHIAEKAAADLDLAVWLHAERAWQLDEMQLDVEKYRDYLQMANRTTERRGRERDAARAERDALQARLDAALAKLDKVREDIRELIELREAGAPIDPAPLSALDEVEESVRAALQGDQPAEPRANRYPGECQNPGCTREDGVCIGYHCPGCGKPTTSMGHPDCVPPAEPTSRAMSSLQDAVTELRRRINNTFALHARDDDGDCRECGVDAYGEAIAWPCATVAALQAAEPPGEADRD